jgi:hypothetical protein
MTSNRMATTTGRSTEPSTAVRTYPNRTTSPTQSPSCPLSGLYSTNQQSAGPTQQKICGLAPHEITPSPQSGQRTPGVYRMPCECDRVYIGQTGRSVDIIIKEHQRHIRLEHADSSAAAEHTTDQGHRIQFHNCSILATKSRYMDRIVRETIEIEFHPYSINRACFLSQYIMESYRLLKIIWDMTHVHSMKQPPTYP